jgi:hypothetical protein
VMLNVIPLSVGENLNVYMLECVHAWMCCRFGSEGGLVRPHCVPKRIQRMGEVLNFRLLT